MMGDRRRVRPFPSVLHPLFEPSHLHPLCSGPAAHIKTAEIVYVLVGDPAALSHDSHEPLLDPQAILISYPVELLDGLARQRHSQRSAKVPFAALPELPALHLHEPFPRHALYYPPLFSPGCIRH